MTTRIEAYVEQAARARSPWQSGPPRRADRRPQEPHSLLSKAGLKPAPATCVGGMVHTRHADSVKRMIKGTMIAVTARVAITPVKSR